MKKVKGISKIVAGILCLSLVANVSMMHLAAKSATGVTKLTLSDFGIIDGTILRDEKLYSVSGTLQDTVIEAVYNFSNSGNAVYYGANWQGLRMEPKNQNLEFMLVDLNKPDEEKYQSIGAITAEEAKRTLLETDIKVSVSFLYKNINGNKADVDITVQVADDYKETYSLTGVNTDILGRNVLFWSNYAEGANNPLSYRSVTEEEDTTSYEKLTLSDFAIADGTVNNDTKYYSVAGNLKDSSVEAVFHFSESGNAVYYGGNWQGLRMEPKNQNLEFMFVDLNKATDDEKYLTLGTITPGEAGCNSLVGADVKIKVSFAFSNIKASERKADVRITVQVADGYKEVFELEAVNLDIVARGIMLWSAENCPMSYKSVKDSSGNKTEEDTTVYESVTLKTLGILDGTITGDTKFYQSGSSLKDTEIIAYYKFSQTGNAVYYGANWQGLRMEPKNGGLQFQFIDLNKTSDTEKYQTLGTVSAEEADAGLTGTDVKIRIAFAYSNISGNTADVRITVQINDGYKAVYKLTGVNTEILGRNVMLWSDTECPLSYKSVEISSEDPEIVKPELKEVTLKQVGITNAVYAYTDGNLVARGDYGASLMNTTMTQKLTFSKQANNWIHFGALESPWYGIRFMADGEETITIAGAGEEFTERYQITAEVAGCELFGREITWTFELFAQGADAYLGVYIDGKLYNDRYFKLTGAADRFGGIVSIYVGDKEGYVQIGTPEPAPTLDDSFAKLTFDSFDVATSTYEYNNGDLAVSGYCGMNSMDKVIFSDTIKFSKEVGAQLRIFGKETPWYGMIFEAIGDGKLRLSDASGVFETMIFDSETAGTDLAGKDLKLTFSMEYVDSDDDGQKDDVKLGIWFNDKPYADRWFYLKDSAANLGGNMLIYCPSEQTSITITTYMKPIDFTIWGFTGRWLYELGLKK